jgi:parallel beta-helix repeat protein
LIDKASPGSTVKVPGGCIYREDIRIKKSIKLVAKPGAEIRGSNVWTGWRKTGRFWKKGKLPSMKAPSRNRCKPGTSRCRKPAQVFLDGRALRQVDNNPSRGQFSVDSNRNIVLADNPRGYKVEVTVRNRWVYGGADNVVIDGFTMKHSAGDGIKNDWYDNWRVTDNNLSYAHATALGLGKAKGLRAVRNNIHHNGKVGIGGYDSSVQILNNKIHRNNTEAFDPGWEAGGIKMAGSNYLLIKGNKIYRNREIGLWIDTEAKNVTIAGNRIHHNRWQGIRYEASKNGEIVGNTIWENGWKSPRGKGFNEAGIALSATRNVEVHRNVLAWNNDGILVVNAKRSKPSQQEYSKSVNNVIHHNSILTKSYRNGGRHISLAFMKAYSGGNIYNPKANNRGHHNRYWDPKRTAANGRYKWKSLYDKLGSFNNTRGGERERYMSKRAKNRIVDNRNIPARPRR